MYHYQCSAFQEHYQQHLKNSHPTIYTLLKSFSPQPIQQTHTMQLLGIAAHFNITSSACTPVVPVYKMPDHLVPTQPFTFTGQQTSTNARWVSWWVPLCGIYQKGVHDWTAAIVFAPQLKDLSTSGPQFRWVSLKAPHGRQLCHPYLFHLYYKFIMQPTLNEKDPGLCWTCSLHRIKLRHHTCFHFSKGKNSTTSRTSFNFLAGTHLSINELKGTDLAILQQFHVI